MKFPFDKSVSKSVNFCKELTCNQCKANCKYELKALAKLKMKDLMNEVISHGHDTHSYNKKKKVALMKMELHNHYSIFHNV